MRISMIIFDLLLLYKTLYQFPYIIEFTIYSFNNIVGDEFMLIKIYARRIKVYTGRKMERRGKWERYACHGGMWAAEDGFLLYTNDFDMISRKAILLIKELAEENAHIEDIEIRIMDIMQNKPAINALLDNIKTIPTVKIGKHKLEGVPKKEDLRKAFGNS